MHKPVCISQEQSWRYMNNHASNSICINVLSLIKVTWVLITKLNQNPITYVDNITPTKL